jgi:hypothetical protein
VKKVSPLIILFFFIAPAHVGAGANHDVPAGPKITVAQAGLEPSNNNLLQLLQNKPTDKKNPFNAGKPAPARPAPVAPADASVISDWNFVFSWKSSPGKASYRLQVSNRPTFTATSLDIVTVSKSYKIISELAPGSYYWRVKAMNAFKKSSAWSKVRRFTVSVMSPSNTTAGNFINRGEASTASTGVSLAIAARSYVGISGYFISEISVPPGAKASGWTTVKPPALSFSSAVPYTLSNGDGTKRVYVWFKDSDERVSASAESSIILDTRPPEAMITSRPSLTSDFAPASFEFTSSMAGSTFECSLDARGYTACSSPRVYEGLAEGRHTFSVKATIAARKSTSSPASYTWDVIRPVVNTTPSNFINHKGNTYLIAQKNVKLSISATATTAENLTAYFASESPDVPKASDPGWKTFSPVKAYSAKVPFAISDGNGTKRIYVWFKDTANNISDGKSDKIVYLSSTYLVILFLVMQVVFII